LQASSGYEHLLLSTPAFSSFGLLDQKNEGCTFGRQKGRDIDLNQIAFFDLCSSTKIIGRSKDDIGSSSFS
jgi:hypothetical protein